MMNHAAFGRVRLADARARGELEAQELTHCFDTDNVLMYIPFCDDFGPMNLMCVMKFVEILEQKLAEYADHQIVYCCEHDSRKLTNATFLLGAFMVLKLDLSPEAVWGSFSEISDVLLGYRDASHLEPDFHLSLFDCWRGLARAKGLGWIEKYDLDEYAHYDNPLEGDLHEMVPDKLFAFRGPRTISTGQTYQDQDGERIFSPSFYIEPFADLNVTTVVRLNESEYDEAAFTSHGIDFVDLEFEDCSAPPAGVILRFLDAARGSDGAVAVHCRAGLGRTGTLIALYMMTTHGFTAREAMGWLRIVRPGSVIGEQQHFLRTVEDLHCDDCAAPAGAGLGGAGGADAFGLAVVAAAAGMPDMCGGRDAPRNSAGGGVAAVLAPIPEDEACHCGGEPAAERRIAAAAQIAAAARSKGRVAAKARQAEALRAGGSMIIPALND